MIGRSKGWSLNASLFFSPTLAVHTKSCESSKDEHTEIIHNWLSSPFSCAPPNSSPPLNVARWVRKELLTKIILRLRIERAQRERAFLISFSSCFTRLHSTHIALRFNTLHRISWQPENCPKGRSRSNSGGGRAGLLRSSCDLFV